MVCGGVVVKICSINNTYNIHAAELGWQEDTRQVGGHTTSRKNVSAKSAKTKKAKQKCIQAHELALDEEDTRQVEKTRALKRMMTLLQDIKKSFFHNFRLSQDQ